MSVLSKLSTSALLIGAGVCFATAAAIVYFLTTEEKFYEETSHDLILTSRHTIIEVPVPAELIGAIIGRHGANVSRIQKETNARLNFKNAVAGEPMRIAVIRGKPAEAQAAESLLRQYIAQQQSVMTFEMKVPTISCGKIIGKNGSNIRMICDVSKAKVTVDRGYDSPDVRAVAIKGTREEIEMAKDMIEELLAEANALDRTHQGELSTATRQLELKGKHQLCITATEEETPRVPCLTTEKLQTTAQDGFMEVFVSAVESPSRFWVQPIGVKATELDKLISNMTDFYADESNAAEHAMTEKPELGDFVAAPFTFDESWYRARVDSLAEDDYDVMDSTVVVYYLDFGQNAALRLKDLCTLHEDFTYLPFQAVECSLHGVVPSGNGGPWSTEAVSLFEDLTHCTHWKVIMLQIVGGGINDDDIKQVVLVDTSDKERMVDVNVANELVKSKLAQRIQEIS